MADLSNKVRENVASHPAVESQSSKREERLAKEISFTKESGKTAYVETVGFDESAETTGKVSEILKEKIQEDTSTTLGTKGQSAKSAKFDSALIKANLLRRIPSEKEMRKEVKKEIEKEIKYLHKRAMSMLRTPGSIDYFEMSNLMKKIRELKRILEDLVKSSLETLKTFWLRFVHGIM